MRLIQRYHRSIEIERQQHQNFRQSDHIRMHYQKMTKTNPSENWELILLIQIHVTI